MKPGCKGPHLRACMGGRLSREELEGAWIEGIEGEAEVEVLDEEVLAGFRWLSLIAPPPQSP